MNKHQFTLKDILIIEEYLSTGSFPKDMGKFQRIRLKAKAALCYVEGESLFVQTELGTREVVPSDDAVSVREVIARTHGIDHGGITVVAAEIAKKYTGIRKRSIVEYVRACDVCQRCQPLKKLEPITSIVAQSPWERIQVDCIDMRKFAAVNNGYKWILNVIDTYSKCMFAFPMQSKGAVEVSAILQALFYREGGPKLMQTDNGREFVNEQIAALCERFAVRAIRGRPRHPQNQGQVERANQTLVRKLARALFNREEKVWTEVLCSVVYAYNTRKHRA